MNAQDTAISDIWNSPVYRFGIAFSIRHIQGLPWQWGLPSMVDWVTVKEYLYWFWTKRAAWFSPSNLWWRVKNGPRDQKEHGNTIWKFKSYLILKYAVEYGRNNLLEVAGSWCSIALCSRVCCWFNNIFPTIDCQRNLTSRPSVPQHKLLPLELME